MAEKKWRKIPMNLIYTTQIQVVVKKLPKERQHSAFTFLTSLYCNADDDGVVDMIDFESYANKIFLTSEELRDLVERFVNASILRAYAPDFDIYAISDWEALEYKKKSKPESWETRMARISQWTTTPPENYQPLNERPKDLEKTEIVDNSRDSLNTTEEYTIPFNIKGL